MNMGINTNVNKYRSKRNQKNQFVSHFIHYLMATFISNTSFVVFNSHNLLSETSFLLI